MFGTKSQFSLVEEAAAAAAAFSPGGVVFITPLSLLQGTKNNQPQKELQVIFTDRLLPKKWHQGYYLFRGYAEESMLQGLKS